MQQIITISSHFGILYLSITECKENYYIDSINFFNAEAGGQQTHNTSHTLNVNNDLWDNLKHILLNGCDDKCQSTISDCKKIMYIELLENRDKNIIFVAKGTKFQISVWHKLLDIPINQTMTYAELSIACGYNRNYARAVGNAVAKNPLLLLIPCHRVLPATGGYGKYAAGDDYKKQLLQWEMSKP